MNKPNAVVFPCDKIIYIPVTKTHANNRGSCLIVPVSIHCVCPNSHLLVIVEIYVENKLYTRSIKKVFTGKSQNPNCNDELIDCLFIDEFKFFFVNECNPKCISVEVDTQYILE